MNREREIYKVTLVGAVVNTALLVFKFIAGVLAHSSAMIADAVHSLSDFVTDIIVIVFVRISSKPADKSHDYGHGKYETLAGTVIGIALLAVAIGIIASGSVKIASWLHGESLESPGILALIAALVSIVLKEGAFRYTLARGKSLDSQALTANAWHHRSDALSSIGTALGIGGAILLGKRWAVLDPLASIIVGAFIVKVAVEMLKTGIDELMEKSLPEDVEEDILKSDVSEPHNLRTRRIGNHFAIEMHLRMDGEKSLRETHRRATAIETDLKQRFGQKTHIAIHMEPIEPENND